MYIRLTATKLSETCCWKWRMTHNTIAQSLLQSLSMSSFHSLPLPQSHSVYHFIWHLFVYIKHVSCLTFCPSDIIRFDLIAPIDLIKKNQKHLSFQHVICFERLCCFLFVCLEWVPPKLSQLRFIQLITIHWLRFGFVLVYYGFIYSFVRFSTLFIDLICL